MASPVDYSPLLSPSLHPTPNPHTLGLTFAPRHRSNVRQQRLAGVEHPPRYMGVVVVLGRAPCDHPLAREQARVV